LVGIDSKPRADSENVFDRDPNGPRTIAVFNQDEPLILYDKAGWRVKKHEATQARVTSERSDQDVTIVTIFHAPILAYPTIIHNMAHQVYLSKWRFSLAFSVMAC